MTLKPQSLTALYRCRVAAKCKEIRHLAAARKTPRGPRGTSARSLPSKPSRRQVRADWGHDQHWHRSTGRNHRTRATKRSSVKNRNLWYRPRLLRLGTSHSCTREGVAMPFPLLVGPSPQPMRATHRGARIRSAARVLVLSRAGLVGQAQGFVQSWNPQGILRLAEDHGRRDGVSCRPRREGRDECSGLTAGKRTFQGRPA